MIKLKNFHILIRVLTLEDIDFLELVDNDEHLWNRSDTLQVFCRSVLKGYLDRPQKDIYKMKTIRQVLALRNKQPIGFIDLKKDWRYNSGQFQSEYS